MSVLAILWIVLLATVKVATWAVPTLVCAVLFIRWANARDDARADR